MSELFEEIGRAAGCILPHVRRTPTEHSWTLGQDSGAEVFLKLENHQVTGSFKARGALHKMMSLTPDQRRRGL